MEFELEFEGASLTWLRTKRRTGGAGRDSSSADDVDGVWSVMV